MKPKSKSAISIIGGADGPTSVFVTGKLKEQSLKTRIQNGIYRYKRKKWKRQLLQMHIHLLRWYNMQCVTMK